MFWHCWRFDATNRKGNEALLGGGLIRKESLSSVRQCARSRLIGKSVTVFSEHDISSSLVSSSDATLMAALRSATTRQAPEDRPSDI